MTVSVTEAALNISNSTPPPKHMQIGVNDLDIDTLLRACVKRGIIPEEFIAEFMALTAEYAIEHNYNPIKLKESQINALLKLINKKVPDRKAVDAEGSSDDKLVIEFVTDYGDAPESS